MNAAGRHRPLALALAAALAAGAIHSGTLGHGFVFDDGPEVVDNEDIRSLAAVPSMFRHSAWKGAAEDNPIYRPLTTASYALNHAWGGLAPFGFHLVNVLLHAAVSALVVALGLALGLPAVAAGLAGLLFAVLPIHVEAVANVAGRKDLLAALFALLALLAHRRALERGGASLLLSPLALAAAMFSKETGVVAVGMILAHDLLFARDRWRAATRRALGLQAAYAAVLALYLLARHAAVGSLGVPADHIPFAENPIAAAPAGVRLPTALSVLGRGIALLVAPVTLSPDYSYAAIPPLADPADPYLLLAVAALAAAAWGAWRTWRTAPVFAFALALYAMAVFPGSNLLVPVGTIFGERLLYLPSVGFCLAAGALGGALAGARARPLRWAAAAALLLALGARSVAYARAWKDELTLFSAGLAAQPRSSKLHQSLGGVLMEQGRPAEAVPHFQAAVEITRGTPGSPTRHQLELGVAYETLGRLDDAAGLYASVVATDPGYADAYWRLGVVRWRQDRRPEAVGLWLKTVAVDPRHARALSDLGIAAAAGGDLAAARALWERATAADPRLASAWFRLGQSYERAGEMARARRAWLEFLDHAHGKFPAEQAEVERKLRGLPPPG